MTSEHVRAAGECGGRPEPGAGPRHRPQGGAPGRGPRRADGQDLDAARDSGHHRVSAGVSVSGS